MRYWLMKSEPNEYGITDLKRDKQSAWFGVRNYQARNFMRDDMQVGDLVFFYHSSCPEPGIAGVCKSRKGCCAGRYAVRQEEPALRPEIEARESIVGLR